MIILNVTSYGLKVVIDYTFKHVLACVNLILKGCFRHLKDSISQLEMEVPE